MHEHKYPAQHVHDFKYCRGCDVVHCDWCQAEWHRLGKSSAYKLNSAETWPIGTGTVTMWSYGQPKGEANTEGC